MLTAEFISIEIDEFNNVLGLEEKPRFYFWVNTGLYIIEPEFIDLIPCNRFIHITDLIQKCIEEGKKVGVYKVDEDSWLDMGQLDALNQMREKLGMY